MKKITFLLSLLLCLTACGGDNAPLERGLALRSSLAQASGCTFSAAVTADYGDKRYAFAMDCQGQQDGTVTFRVTAPETISGITGTLSGDGGALTFGDTALYFPALAEGLVSPVSAPWLLVTSLAQGCITSAGMDGELLRLSIDDSYADEALHLDIWCDANDRPVRGEIRWLERTILSLTVTEFALL